MSHRDSADDFDIPCDGCGKRHAKQAGNFRFLCVECRKAEDDDGYDD